MNVFDTMQVLQSSLSAQRIRMNTTASNLANAHTTRTQQGGPYRRKDPVFAARAVGPGGAFTPFGRALDQVVVRDIQHDGSPPRMAHNPHHPDSNAEGFVAMPNVNMVEEMVNMLTASRSYEASISAWKSATEMAEKALTLAS